MRIRSILMTTLIGSIMLAALVLIGGCSGGSGGDAPKTSTILATTEVQPTYTGPKINHYSTLDPDGDGVPDINDPFPLDATKKSLVVLDEGESSTQGFNNNLNQAKNTNASYPQIITGKIDSSAITVGTGKTDEDYFKFTATKGDRISIVLFKGTINSSGALGLDTTSAFTPTLQLINTDGTPVIGQTEIATARGGFSSAIGFEVSTTGSYAFVVSDITLTSTSYSFPYVVKIFKDADFDGLSDDQETDLSMNKNNADSDGDGIPDGVEFYSYLYAPVGSAVNWWDPDGDGIPNWYDVDSDGDGIPDRLEGTGDVDGDGISNFLDTDSDGNGILDSVEAGSNLLRPLDSDGDGIPDYLDTDDDNDGIPDKNDSERLSPAVPTDITNLATRLMLSRIYVKVGSAEVNSTVKPGDTVTVEGDGFSSTTQLSIQTTGGRVAISPSAGSTAIREHLAAITATIPANAVSGNIYAVDGNKLSNALPVRVITANDPVITAITPLSASPASTVTITGLNFGSGSITVNFAGAQATGTSNANGTTISVTVPSGAVTGPVTVFSATAVSNPFGLTVRRNISGTITSPAGMGLDLTTTTVEYGVAPDEYVAPTASGNFTVPVLNAQSDAIQVLYPATTDRPGGGVFLTSLVLPGDSSVSISSTSSAVHMVFTGLGLTATLKQSSLAAARTLVAGTPEVTALASYIETTLPSNKFLIANFTDSTLISKYKTAISAAYAKVSASVSAGSLVPASNPTVVLAANLMATVSPSKQYDVSVYETTTDRGNLTVENDTMMYLSAKMTTPDGKTVFQQHVTGYYDENIIGMQGVLNWSGLFASDTKEFKQPKGHNAIVEVVTPGALDPIGSTSVTKYIGFKTYMNGFALPVINEAAKYAFKSDIEANFILELFMEYGAGAIDQFAGAVANKDVVGAFKIPLTVLYNDITKVPPPGPITKKIVERYAKGALEEVIKKLTLKFGEKFIPVVGQIKGALDVIGSGSTIIGSGKTINDFMTTPGKLIFNVSFPLEVTDVNPACFLNSIDPKKFLITGKGFSPIISGGYISSTEEYPKVTFPGSIDGDVKNIKNDGTSMLVYGSGSIGNGPVTVKHGGSEVASPMSIKGVDSVNLISLSPAEGSEGTTVKISGCGFSDNLSENIVTFTGDSGSKITATVTGKEEGSLIVVAPKGVKTGPVSVTTKGVGSNQLTFTVKTGSVTITFGDNGSATDDTFALYVDNKLIYTMPSPTTSTSHNVELAPGNHTVKLIGITAPDDVGTYFIDFSGNVSVTSGPALSGTDLTAGVVKTWTINVAAVGAVIKAPLYKFSGKTLWRE